MYKRGIKMKRRKLKSCWLRYTMFICFCLLLIYCGRRQTSEIDINYTSTKTETKISNEPIKIEYMHPSQPVKTACKIENEFTPVFDLSEEERWIACCMIAGEAEGESYDGQWAVAQCILNAMKQDNLTASEVREIYQYSGWDDQLKYLNMEAWNEVCHAVWCVFDNGEVVTQENILWFYNPNISEGKFHNTQKFVLEIGNHRFYAPYP